MNKKAPTECRKAPEELIAMGASAFLKKPQVINIIKDYL